MTKRPKYTDHDGTRKAPYQYSEQYQQWRAAVLRGDKAATIRAAHIHSTKFNLFKGQDNVAL